MLNELLNAGSPVEHELIVNCMTPCIAKPLSLSSSLPLSRHSDPSLAAHLPLSIAPLSIISLSSLTSLISLIYLSFLSYLSHLSCLFSLLPANRGEFPTTMLCGCHLAYHLVRMCSHDFFHLRSAWAARQCGTLHIWVTIAVIFTTPDVVNRIVQTEASCSIMATSAANLHFRPTAARPGLERCGFTSTTDRHREECP